MSDITLNHITNSFGISVINDNADIIEDSINNDILHLSGGNNVMLQQLDMNSNLILNVQESDNPLSVATVNQLNNLVLGRMYGPTSSTDGAVALFDGTTGNVLKNGPILADVAITGGYSDLVGIPTFGTAAWEDVGYFATAAQGTLAENAVAQSQLGIANGVATLGSDGVLTTSQIPSSILGQMKIMGPWDASSGSPPSGSPSEGQYWLVTVAGSTNLSGITDWKVGDWAIYDTILGWYKCDNTDSVSSVAGLTGVITTASLQTALSLGTAAYTSSSAYATAAQGILAASALQPDASGQLATTARRRKIIALGNITGLINIDLSSGDIITGTLTGNVTLAWTNLPASGYGADIELRLTQDATGSRTVTWPASTKWPGGATYVVTPTASAMDVIGFTVNSAGASIGYPVEAVA